MGRLPVIRVLMALVLILLAADAVATPTPKGLEIEVPHAHVGPFRVLLAQRSVSGSWVSAQWIQIAADDSLRVVVYNPGDGSNYLPPGTGATADHDATVNRQMRHGGSGLLQFQGPAFELWIYPPATGTGTGVGVNVWCEY